jgi:predicted transglutaminase-like cysteine proteinase
MRRVCGVILGLAVALMAGPSFSAQRTKLATLAVPAVTSAAAVTGETRPPVGWVDFCLSHHAECEAPELEALDVTVTPETWATLVRINRTVNHRIEQVEDQELYGVPEKWAYPDEGKGDCEDIVLMKRRLLMQAGFPRQALLITVVRDHEGAGHAVLTVKTDRGDFILDNKENRILPWQSTGYGFVKRQSQEQPNRWVMLGVPAPSGLTVAGSK